MDLSQLKTLGEVAGIGGIALGVVVLLVRPLITVISGLPRDARAGPVKLIAVGCFFIGALGIAAWMIGSQSGGRQVSTHGMQSPAVISGGDAVVSYGASPAVQRSSPQASAPASPSGAVHTEGNQSPGVVAGSKVEVEYGAAPASAPSLSGTR